MPRKRSETPRLRQASNLGYSVSYTPEEVTLYSGDAQSLLRHFNFTSAALYKMGISLRRLTTEERVKEIERVVYDEILNPLKNDLAAEVTRFEQQFGNPELKAEFTKPFKGTAQIQYPRAKILLHLLVDFDKLLLRVHQLWHAELLDDAEYLRVTDDFRLRLKDSEKRIDQMVRQAIQLAQKEKEDVEVEAGIKAMSASAVSTEAPQDTTKASGRRGRKAAETIAPAPETKEEDQEKGKETPLMDTGEAPAYSPFEQIQ
jgi:hypothetical protein